MKRLGIVVLMICLCLPLFAAAQEELETIDPINGYWWAPQDGTEQEANCLFRYAYPQFAALSDADKEIDAYLKDLSETQAKALFEQFSQEAAEVWVQGMPPATAQLDYEITLNNQRYVSILMTTQHMLGNGESVEYSSLTFARDGLYAGKLLTLSQVLGLEEAIPEGGQSTAQALSYRLVWEIIQSQMGNTDGGYLSDVTLEAVQASFEPETDFYLNEDGNIVFFLQPGVAAAEVAGVLTFNFAPDEILSELLGNS